MGAARSHGRALARLLAVCAVLLGVFLMHGTPATAATGCHEAMTALAPMPGEHAAHGEHSAAVEAATAALPASAHAVSPAMTGEHGAQCVATPVRDRILLPTIWLLAAVVIGSVSVWMLLRRVAAGQAGRRGPPGSGRDLLLRVCVSRN
ncbi:hypothetical protein AB0K89_11565 [Streptomyces cinnamoneus]|uniref:hypothetical protein n=1 Tax=Streptomyces cinnamoneus TaxID=53446 RepID=UPI003429287B